MLALLAVHAIAHSLFFSAAASLSRLDAAGAKTGAFGPASCFELRLSVWNHP